MNCRQFDRVFVDAAPGRLMDTAVRDEALAHARNCSRCAAQMGEQYRLTSDLRALGEEWGAAGAPEYVEARVLEAFRRGKHQAEESRPGRLRRWLIWAMAAAASIAAMLVGFRTLAPPQPNEHPAMAIKAPSAPIPAVEVAHSQPSRPVPSLRKRAVRRPRPKPFSAENREIATGFFPLPHGDSLPAMEVAPVVRVRLPRTVLLSFGLPMNEDRAAEPVLADVVLGPEGTARAIRFVWTTSGDH